MTSSDKMNSAHVIAAVDDMFFASKIRATAEQLGVRISFVRSVETAVEAARKDPPSLIISDLHSQKIDPLELSRQLKSEESLSRIPLVGFFSHVETELADRARQAGFDQVIPRSAFTRNLGDILLGVDPAATSS
jgi:PleD family two-component response regulator